MAKNKTAKKFHFIGRRKYCKKKYEGYKKSKYKNKKKEIFELQKSVINNALKLNDSITIIINAFVDKAIFSVDVEKDVYYNSERSEPKFEERISERAKKRRKKYDWFVRDKKYINMEVFQKHFKFPSSSLILSTIKNVYDVEN